MVRFEVVSRAGGSIRVAGLALLPEGADTVLLGIHGAGAVARTEWGPAPIPGYSFAHAVAAEGRGFVGIDLPGYGDSEARGEAASIEDHVFVVAQVADLLRAGAFASDGAVRGFSTVIALGSSLGGLIALQAEGHFAPFDAVATLAWSPAGFRDEAADCMSGSGSCPEPIEMFFVPENADPRILEWALSLPAVEMPGTTAEQTRAWFGCYACSADLPAPLREAPSPQSVGVARVGAPVLLLQGLDDWLMEPTSEPQARAAFASARDVTVVDFPRTGHALQHHLVHEEAQREVLAWLAERGW